MQKALNNNELSSLARQLSMLLHSGISVLESVSILREDAVSSDGKEILGGLYERLEETGEFAEAMQQTGWFPDYFQKMTALGEQSGTLEETMASLASYYERQETMLTNIRNALTYPLILLGMLFAILLVLVTQVMPVFEKVFSQLGIEMTGVTSAVFRITHVLQGCSVVLLIGVLTAAAAGIIWLRTASGRARLLKLILPLPVTREISHLTACAHFSDALSMALHCGLDVGESFSLAGDVSTQPQFQMQLKKAEALQNEGEEFAVSLNKAGIYSGMNARLLSIGFRTGDAEDALKDISIRAGKQAEERLQNAIGKIEPTMTAILSVLTGLILVSVMLPLLSIMAGIG